MRKFTKEDFVKKAKYIHKNKYDYSLVDYENSKVKVRIICKKHGIFEQTPNAHLSNHGCSVCAGVTNSDIEDFIKKAKFLYNNRYDYSLVKYINAHTKVNIICKKHGIFEQTPNSHIRKNRKENCPKCNNENIAKRQVMSKKIFLNKARLVHGNKYNYSLVNYKNSHIKIKIICKKHGVFEQSPFKHLNEKQGCSICKSSKMENRTRKYLQQNNIIFEEQKKFKELTRMRYDFCVLINDETILIECDGKQHYKPIKHFGGDKNFIKTKIRDEIKNKFAEQKNIKLIRIPYTDFNKIEDILKAELGV
jgi:hypothetical protein